MAPHATSEAGAALISELSQHTGEPLGQALLQVLRPFDRGAVGLIAQLGALL